MATHKAEGEHTRRIAAAILITAVVFVSAVPTATAGIDSSADPARLFNPVDINARVAAFEGRYAITAGIELPSSFFG